MIKNQILKNPEYCGQGAKAPKDLKGKNTVERYIC